MQSGCSSLHSAVDYLVEGAPFTTMVAMLVDNTSSLFEEVGDVARLCICTTGRWELSAGQARLQSRVQFGCRL